jgi:hypothetical protein
MASRLLSSSSGEERPSKKFRPRIRVPRAEQIFFVEY